MRRALRSRPGILVVAAVAALIAATALAYAALWGYVAQSEGRRRAAEAVRHLLDVESLLWQAESGRRGYLLTGDGRFLLPYDRAVAVLPEALATLRPEDPWRAADLDRVRSLALTRLGELTDSIVLARDGRTSEAVATVRTGRGMALMADLHDRVEALAGSSAARARTRSGRIDRFGRLALVTVPLVGLLGLAVVASSLWVAGNQYRARVVAEAEAEGAREQNRYNADLLNALSHDLRTPLNAVAQSLYLAREMLSRHDRDGTAEAVEDALQSVRAQSEMLAGFLDAARADRGAVEFAPVRLGPLLADVADLVRPDAARKGLALRVYTVPPDIVVTTDRAKLHRILMNLLSNAVKFTDRGAVTVEAARRRGGRVRVCVVDTGRGIEPSLLPHLFHDFVQGSNPARDPARGYGLGLSIARRLADALGARIEVQSTPGRGSTFTVTLP